jgi:hypothetical protein
MREYHANIVSNILFINIFSITERIKIVNLNFSLLLYCFIPLFPILSPFSPHSINFSPVFDWLEECF